MIFVLEGTEGQRQKSNILSEELKNIVKVFYDNPHSMCGAPGSVDPSSVPAGSPLLMPKFFDSRKTMPPGQK